MVKGASSNSKQVLRAALAKRASTVAAATKNSSSSESASPKKKSSSETQSKPASAASATRQPKKETVKQQQKKEKKVKAAPTKTEREPSTASNVETSSSALGHEVKKLSKKERKRIALAGKKQSFPTAAPGAPCTIRDLMTASLLKNNNSLSTTNNNNNNNNNNSSSQNKKNNNGKNTVNNSSSSLDPFNFTPSNDWQDAASGDNDDTDNNIYQTPDSLLQEGNKFFIKRNKEERALTKAAMKQIEEMKRVNQKGGDSAGFKYIIPKSAKKLASRLAGDVDITLDDKKDAVKGKLLPSANSMIADGDDVNEMGGLNQDDRPMRKKKPRASKELKDFYTWQKWKSWTKNAENFLQRGKLSRKVFDSKRKFKSV